MSADQPLIIKRIKKKGGHGHHGGAWKIAYADFVTAMMAFFLLMWLLGFTDDEKRKGISEYFENPLRVSMAGGQSVGEQTRLIPGGGDDLTRREGEVFRGELPPSDLQEYLDALDRVELEELRERIEEAIDSIETLSRFREQLLLEMTDEGLRIQIIDLENRPMFELGSARLQPHASEILSELVELLNTVGNRVSITGHTDATPFAAGEAGYSNWELSNDRANAARRAMVGSGLEAHKIMRIVGLASSVPLDSEDPFSPINRRVSILVLNRSAEQAIRDDGYAGAGEAGATAAALERLVRPNGEPMPLVLDGDEELLLAPGNGEIDQDEPADEDDSDDGLEDALRFDWDDL